jgi:uncharacterized protein
VTKISNYIQELALPDGKLLLANLLWQTFLELTPDERQEWNRLKEGGPVSRLSRRLLEQKMLIDAAVDELKLMRISYRNNRHASDVLGLTIAPTIDCNLACVYCYENKKKGVLTPDVERQIRAYVDALLPGRKKLNIIWYGGEPLLCKESVFSLSEFFRDRCHVLDAIYSAQMTTNAMLLTPSVAQRMAEIGGWTRIQITMDGGSEHHDQRRPAKGGQGTFKKIYANLVHATNVLPISLRMNVDRGNVGGCENLLNQLSQDLPPDKLHVYFSPTHFYGKGCRDIAESEELSIFDHHAFADINTALIERARSLGFRTNNQLAKKPVMQCQAVSTHSIIVEPDGGIQRCWTEIGEDDRRIGHIASPIEINSPNSLRWLSFDPTVSDPCRTCEVLPTCFGGCPQRHLDGRPQEMICAGIRFNTKAALLNDYIALHRPDLQSLVQPRKTSCGSCAQGPSNEDSHDRFTT